MTKRRRKKNLPKYESARDADLIRRCVREGWNPPQKVRDRLVGDLDDIIKNGTEIQGVAAVRAIIEMVDANQKDQAI